MYSGILTGVFVFPMGRGIWRGGETEGNSERLQKIYLAKTELLSCRIFYPAADFTLVLCISRGAFYWHLMEEKCCFNNADCLLTVVSQLFPRVDYIVWICDNKEKNSVFSLFPFSKINRMEKVGNSLKIFQNYFLLLFLAELENISSKSLQKSTYHLAALNRFSTTLKNCSMIVFDSPNSSPNTFFLCGCDPKRWWWSGLVWKLWTELVWELLCMLKATKNVWSLMINKSEANYSFHCQNFRKCKCIRSSQMRFRRSEPFSHV